MFFESPCIVESCYSRANHRFPFLVFNMNIDYDFVYEYTRFPTNNTEVVLRIYTYECSQIMSNLMDDLIVHV